MDSSDGSIRMPIRIDLLFEWALSRCFGTLPMESYTDTRGPLVFGRL